MNTQATTLNTRNEKSGIWSAIKTWFKIRAKRRTDRAAFQHMMKLDDEILQDIGVTRDDVIWANSLPIKMNASRELQKVSRIK